MARARSKSRPLTQRGFDPGQGASPDQYSLHDIGYGQIAADVDQNGPSVWIRRHKTVVGVLSPLTLALLWVVLPGPALLFDGFRDEVRRACEHGLLERHGTTRRESIIPTPRLRSVSVHWTARWRCVYDEGGGDEVAYVSGWPIGPD